MSQTFAQLKARLGVSVLRDDLAPFYGDYLNEAIRETENRHSFVQMKRQVDVSVYPPAPPVALVPTGLSRLLWNVPNDGYNFITNPNPEADQYATLQGTPGTICTVTFKLRGDVVNVNYSEICEERYILPTPVSRVVQFTGPLYVSNYPFINGLTGGGRPGYYGPAEFQYSLTISDPPQMLLVNNSLVTGTLLPPTDGVYPPTPWASDYGITNYEFSVQIAVGATIRLASRGGVFDGLLPAYASCPDNSPPLLLAQPYNGTWLQLDVVSIVVNTPAVPIPLDMNEKQTAPLPLDFKELQKREAVQYITDDGQFIPADLVTEEQQIRRVWAFGGTPIMTWPPRVFYERTAAGALLGVVEPLSHPFNFRVKYYGYLPDLVADTDTSPLVDAYPKLILAKAKEIAFTEINDEIATQAEMEFEKRLGEAIRQDSYSDVRGLETRM